MHMHAFPFPFLHVFRHAVVHGRCVVSCSRAQGLCYDRGKVSRDICRSISIYNYTWQKRGVEDMIDRLVGPI